MCHILYFRIKKVTTMATMLSAIKENIKGKEISFLRISIGIIFIWFGALKFLDGVSPAQELAVNTVDLLTFGLLKPKLILIGLALFEVFIGLGLVCNIFISYTIYALVFQMLGTLTTFVLFPDVLFLKLPFFLSFEGQYIMKNFIIISAALVIHSSNKTTPCEEDEGVSKCKDSCGDDVYCL